MNVCLFVYIFIDLFAYRMLLLPLLFFLFFFFLSAFACCVDYAVYSFLRFSICFPTALVVVAAHVRKFSLLSQSDRLFCYSSE